ncbi:hypothetical protein PHSC3_000132 [Chlamydiales bacterium STE3]|nr:hypothetical protein PHSC3_000132 [Chlamydiales bacterium STE3]
MSLISQEDKQKFSLDCNEIFRRKEAAFIERAQELAGLCKKIHEAAMKSKQIAADLAKEAEKELKDKYKDPKYDSLITLSTTGFQWKILNTSGKKIQRILQGIESENENVLERP